MTTVHHGPLHVLLAHDPKLVLIAALVCVAGAVAAMALARQSFESVGATRAGWLFLCAVTTGAAIWTTHFVAMLSFDPGYDVGYDPALTSLSLFIAVGGGGIGFAVAAMTPTRIAALLGGAFVGLAGDAMHFTGMAAVRVPGHFTWDPWLVFASLLAGAVFAAASVDVVRNSKPRHAEWVGAALFTAAICGLHFLAMAALRFVPDNSTIIPQQLIPNDILGYIVAGIALLIVGSGFATKLISRNDQAEASASLKNLADAAIEGIVLTDGSQILDVNESFLAIVGARDPGSLRGTNFSDLVQYVEDMPGSRSEGVIQGAAGPVPVEIIARDSGTDARFRRIYAVRDLTERHEAERRIRYLAHHDALTGLPNRASFQDRIAADLLVSRSRGEHLAVILVDLDRFKEINDLYGHAAGDAVLRNVAARISPLLGERDFFARLGGDEFALLQPAQSQPAASASLAEKLLEAFSREMTGPSQSVTVGLTLGIAVYPRDGDSAEKLLANADLALYRAKESGRHRVCFFAPEMDEAVRDRRHLSQELRLAIQNDTLQVFYQPQTAIGTGAIVGYEALLRWPHAERGYVAPDLFVRIAEETDLILSLGEWVIRTVCREAVRWREPHKVAVNLSAVQLRQTNLPDLIQQILLTTGMPAGRLEFEITETSLIEDPQRALDLLRRIKAFGISVAMDDFGTGYSSLSTLQAFPFDKLKIDKSFVAQLGERDQAALIVRAVLGLGRSLQIPVLAEGVETAEQLAFLAKEGCDQAQGYLFGRPAPLSDLGQPEVEAASATGRIRAA